MIDDVMRCRCFVLFVEVCAVLVCTRNNIHLCDLQMVNLLVSSYTRMKYYDICFIYNYTVAYFEFLPGLVI